VPEIGLTTGNLFREITPDLSKFNAHGRSIFFERGNHIGGYVLRCIFRSRDGNVCGYTIGSGWQGEDSQLRWEVMQPFLDWLPASGATRRVGSGERGLARSTRLRFYYGSLRLGDAIFGLFSSGNTDQWIGYRLTNSQCLVTNSQCLSDQ
jgi:hypothetical protein